MHRIYLEEIIPNILRIFFKIRKIEMKFQSYTIFRHCRIVMIMTILIGGFPAVVLQYFPSFITVCRMNKNVQITFVS